jgi:hypothetical protein
MKTAGWVLVNEEGKMFSITDSRRLVWTENIQLAVILSTKEWAEKTKDIYTTFLGKSRPMKLQYSIYEPIEFVK